MRARTPLPSPHITESILVYGPDETIVAAVAVGFSLRDQGAFAWADCAGLERESSELAHRLFARGADVEGSNHVNEATARPPEWTPGSLRRLLAPGSRSTEARLANYLELPELYQRLIARLSPRDGRATILLANIDALTPEGRVRLVEPSQIHERLHREGVTLVATCRGAPGYRTLRPFDRVFRVEIPRGRRWSDGFLYVEKGWGAGPEAHPWPLREAWDLLGFDPSLAPP